MSDANEWPEALIERLAVGHYADDAWDEATAREAWAALSEDMRQEWRRDVVRVLDAAVAWRDEEAYPEVMRRPTWGYEMALKLERAEAAVTVWACNNPLHAMFVYCPDPLECEVAGFTMTDAAAPVAPTEGRAAEAECERLRTALQECADAVSFGHMQAIVRAALAAPVAPAEPVCGRCGEPLGRGFHSGDDRFPCHSAAAPVAPTEGTNE